MRVGNNEISLKFHFWPDFGKSDLKFGILVKSYAELKLFRPNPMDFRPFSAIFNFLAGIRQIRPQIRNPREKYCRNQMVSSESHGFVIIFCDFQFSGGAGEMKFLWGVGGCREDVCHKDVFGPQERGG